MNIRNLFKRGDSRAVSPVIGVILMVAITVILAAVIGAFVIGIGEDQEVQPTASFNFDQSTLNVSNISGNPDDEVNSVTVRHSTGDTIPSDELSISVNGNNAWIVNPDATTPNIEEPFNGGEISSGSQATIAAAGNDGTDGEEVTDYTDGATDDHFTLASDAVDRLDEGDTVQVIWTSETGDSSSTLGTRDIQ